MYSSAENNIKNQVNNAISYLSQSNIEVDCILLDGGGNDAYFDTPIGTVNQGDEITTGDTIAASFEDIIYTLKTTYPNAKIVYLQLLNLDVVTDFSEPQKQRYEEIIEQIQLVIQKYGLEYYDLSSYVQAEHIQADGLHFNETGHNALIPYIAAKIDSLI